MINPVLAAGQIEGGVAQAIGMTLYENVVWENGRMKNGQMTNYIMPTAADIPPIRVYFEENPTPMARPARKASASYRWTAGAGDPECDRECDGREFQSRSVDAGSDDGNFVGVTTGTEQFTRLRGLVPARRIC